MYYLENPDFNFVIMVSGFISKHLEHLLLTSKTDEKISVKSLLVVGDQDDIIPTGYCIYVSANTGL